MKSHYCTGSIISKTAILTAAHCNPKMQDEVIFGTNDNSQQHSQGNIPIKKIILHADYNETTYDNDVAIIILESNIKFAKDVGPICLPGIKEIQVGQDLIMTGWGYSFNFDYLLFKYGLVLPPFQFIDSTGFVDFDKLKKHLLDNFKNIVPNFSEMIDDDFKVINASEPMRNLSHVRFESMLAEKNGSPIDLYIASAFYPFFLNWIIDNSDSLSEGLNASDPVEGLEAIKKLFKVLTARIHTFRFAGQELKEANAVKMDDSYCTVQNPANNLCIKPVGGIDNDGGICGGDSGGPVAALIDNHYVVAGIASAVTRTFPFTCECSSCRDENGEYYPALFQKTQIVLDWIKKNLEDNDALPELKSRKI